MDFVRGLFAQEKKALGGIAPAPTIRRRPGRSYRKRWPTGHGTDRDHAYVQNPPHVQPPHSARPFVSQVFDVLVAGASAYTRLFLVPFHGNLAVPREYKVIIRAVLVLGVHSVPFKIDPTLTGRWELRKNGIPVDNLTEMRPSRQTDVLSQISAGPGLAVTDFTPLHAPIHGKGGDVFEVRVRAVGLPWIASAVVSGYLYPMQSSGDTIREAWADKPTSA